MLPNRHLDSHMLDKPQAECARGKGSGMVGTSFKVVFRQLHDARRGTTTRARLKQGAVLRIRQYAYKAKPSS